MKTDVILASFKFAAILLTGVFGAMGLLGKYKDDQGKITKWGRWALVGIILSTSVAAVINGIEIYRLKEDARTAEARRSEESKRTSTLLAGISRAVYSIKDIGIGSYYLIPLKHPKLLPYLKRLDRGTKAAVIKDQVLNYQSIVPPTPGVLIEFNIDHNGKLTPFAAYIKSIASIYPRKDRDKLAWNLIDSLGIQVDLYREPVDITLYNNPHTRPTADLHIVGKADIPTFWYDFAGKYIAINGTMRVQPGSRSSKGTVVSVPDLAGAQVFVTFAYNDTPTSDIVNSIAGIENTCEITVFVLEVGDLAIPLDLVRLPSSKQVVYVATLPESLEPREGSTRIGYPDHK